MAPFSRWLLLGVLLLAAVAPASLRAQDDTNRFLFLTLRLKAGVVTIEKAQVVTGRLKPQLDSSDAEPLQLTLEHADGKEHWSVAINDPSLQRFEFEDPQHPGALKSRVVPVDDVEFVARVPYAAGVRHLAVYRRQKNDPAAKAGTIPAKKLLSRIALPAEVTK